MAQRWTLHPPTSVPAQSRLAPPGSGSYDLVQDRTHDGRTFRMLTVTDELTRRRLAIPVARKLRSGDVLVCLTQLFTIHGPPKHIRSDYGSEFTANAVRDRLGRIDVMTLFLTLHCPQQNGMIERLVRSLKEQCLHHQRLGGQVLGSGLITRK